MGTIFMPCQNFVLFFFFFFTFLFNKTWPTVYVENSFTFFISPGFSLFRVVTFKFSFLLLFILFFFFFSMYQHYTKFLFGFLSISEDWGFFFFDLKLMNWCFPSFSSPLLFFFVENLSPKNDFFGGNIHPS